jgi:membrane-bound lytic murein transglycosylase B
MPETCTRVMRTVQPDMGVLDEIRNQPEFREQLWHYPNRRVSDWRIPADQEMLAVQNYQKKIGMRPADGYADVGLLARLRNGS